MSDSHERISPTAYVTSYVWHRIGMPNAKPFATWGGFTMFWAFRVLFESWLRLVTRSPTLLRVLEYRHRLIDAAVARHEPDVLVEIAAGLSRRAVTWAADHGTRAIEIDLPHVTAAKRGFIDRAPDLVRRLGDRHQLVTRDALGDDFADELAKLLGESKRPVVVAEGLLTYFTPEQRLKLLTSVARALDGRDSLLLTDAYTKDRRSRTALGSAALKLAIRLVTRGQGTRDSWPNQAALEATWREAGFDDVKLLDPLEFEPKIQTPLSFERAPGVVVAAR